MSNAGVMTGGGPVRGAVRDLAIRAVAGSPRIRRWLGGLVFAADARRDRQVNGLQATAARMREK